MELSNILTVIFSSGALIFSLLNYNRGKRYENENFIYKEKVEVYSKILCDLEKLIRFLSHSINSAEYYLEDPNTENRKVLNTLANEVDQICYDFNNYITGHSLIIPESIVRLLSNFCDKILDNESLDSGSQLTKKDIHNTDKLINSLVKDAETIGVALRKDLHIDTLNSSLFRRLK